METTTSEKERVFRVKAGTPTTDLGAAIAPAIYDGEAVLLKSIGHGAAGQAVKGAAVAESLIGQRALHVKSNFMFFNTTMPDGEVWCGITIRMAPD